MRIDARRSPLEVVAETLPLPLALDLDDVARATTTAARSQTFTWNRSYASS